MPTFARLNRELQSRLAAFCARHRVSKAEAIARGVELLLRSEADTGRHPAFVAYQRVAAGMRQEPGRARRAGSSGPVRRAMRSRYPD